MVNTSAEAMQWSLPDGKSNNTGGNNSVYYTYSTQFSDGDIIGIAIDLIMDKIYFHKNGTWQNSGNVQNGTHQVCYLVLIYHYNIRLWFMGNAYYNATKITI